MNNEVILFIIRNLKLRLSILANRYSSFISHLVNFRQFLNFKVPWAE